MASDHNKIYPDIATIEITNSKGEKIEWNGFKELSESGIEYIGDCKFFLPDDAKKVTFRVYDRKHTSKKKFKKWLMSNGIRRNEAELLCRSIKCFNGKISYRWIYLTQLLKSEVTFFSVWKEIFNCMTIKDGNRL